MAQTVNRNSIEICSNPVSDGEMEKKAFLCSDNSHSSQHITIITVNDGVMQQLLLQSFPLYPNNTKLE